VRDGYAVIAAPLEHCLCNDTLADIWQWIEIATDNRVNREGPITWASSWPVTSRGKKSKAFACLLPTFASAADVQRAVQALFNTDWRICNCLQSVAHFGFCVSSYTYNHALCFPMDLCIYAAVNATVHTLYHSDLRICSSRQSYSADIVQFRLAHLQQSLQRFC
jgi:hypothetical protein